MKNLQISRKIAVLLSILILLNIAVAIKLITGMSVVNEQSREITTNWLPALESLGKSNVLTSAVRRFHMRMVISTDAESIQKAEDSLVKVVETLNKELAFYETTVTLDEEKKLYANVQAAWAAYMANTPKLIELIHAQKNEEAKAFVLGQMYKDYGVVTDALDVNVKFNHEHALAAAAEADRTYHEEKVIGIVAIVISLAFAFAVVVLLTRNIAKPINGLKEYMGVLQSGDYNQQVPLTDRRDEIGEMAASIQSFKESLIATRTMEAQQQAEAKQKLERQGRVDVLIKNFDAAASSAVTTVASAATELSHTAQEMNSAAVRTNDQVTVVATASGETSTTVQAVAAAAEEMSASVNEISKQVAHSVGIVRDAMNEAKAADTTSQEMLAATRSINVVTEMIQGIAGQINLLALNATIESARAGEAGRGFAVVASEVKTLANQTAKATEDIRSQLEGVQGMAQNVAEALVRLTGAVEKVNEVSSAIAAAVEEQTAVTSEIVGNMNIAASGVERINGNLDGIRQSAASNSAATQEILGASSELSQQAENLNHQVRDFLTSIKTA